MIKLTKLFLTLAFFTVSPAAAQGDLYFGLTILDPDAQTMQENQYILVENGLIVELGFGLPQNLGASVERHDMSGLFAMPGLIDSHAHPTIGPLYVNMQENGVPVIGLKRNDEMAQYNARLLLGHGVTTIRNPGSDTEAVIRFRNEISAGLYPGPDSLVAGLIIDNSPFPMVNLVADRSERSIPQIVADQVDQGVDYVKLYTSLTPEELAVGIEAAHANKIRAVAHLGDVSWIVAAKMGIDAVVHMMPTSPDLLPEDMREEYLATRRPGAYEFFEWYEYADLDGSEITEMINVMAREGIHIDATLIVFYLAFWGDKPEIRDAYNHLNYPDSLENWQTMFKFDAGWTEDDYNRAKAIWPKVLRLTKMMHDAGVPITLGTDQGNPFVAPGVSLYQEMQLHSDAGISNWDILKMATTEASNILQINNRTGRISRGLEADIIFLEKNPSLDIANIATVKAVISNGQFFFTDELVGKNGAQGRN